MAHFRPTRLLSFACFSAMQSAVCTVWTGSLHRTGHTHSVQLRKLPPVRSTSIPIFSPVNPWVSLVAFIWICAFLRRYQSRLCKFIFQKNEDFSGLYVICLWRWKTLFGLVSRGHNIKVQSKPSFQIFWLEKHRGQICERPIEIHAILGQFYQFLCNFSTWWKLRNSLLQLRNFSFSQ